MIRAMQKADIDRVSDIWLDTNRKAHHFIPAQYWQSNYDAVKEMQSQGIGKRLLDFVKDKKAELCLFYGWTCNRQRAEKQWARDCFTDHGSR